MPGNINSMCPIRGFFPATESSSFQREENLLTPKGLQLAEHPSHSPQAMIKGGYQTPFHLIPRLQAPFSLSLSQSRGAAQRMEVSVRRAPSPRAHFPHENFAEAMRRRGVPAFGSWNHCETLPVIQYSGPASQAGLVQGGGGLGGGCVGGGGHLYPPHLPYYCYYGQDAGEDLFPGPAPPPVVVTAYPRKAWKEATPKKQLKRRKQLLQQQPQKGVGTPQQAEQKDQRGKVCDCNVTGQQRPRRSRTAIAVDEDLYKVPPNQIYQKCKKKKMLLSHFWSRCLGLNCIP